MKKPGNKQLELFGEWLQNRGRARKSMIAYTCDVRRAYAVKGGPIARINDSSLAPKSRRRLLAALRSWCKFSKNYDLRDQLEDVKLPVAVRITPKEPLDGDDWRELIAEIDSADYIDDPTRAVLGLMATRGFRVGDVLRLTRRQVAAAVKGDLLSVKMKGSRIAEFRSKHFKPYLETLSNQKKWDRVCDLLSPRSHTDDRVDNAARYIRIQLRKCAESIGLDPRDVYPHRLRRTYCVEFLKAMGADPRANQKLTEQMQWANIKTSFEYTDYIARDELEAVDDMLFGR